MLFLSGTAVASYTYLSVECFTQLLFFCQNVWIGMSTSDLLLLYLHAKMEVEEHIYPATWENKGLLEESNRNEKSRLRHRPVRSVGSNLGSRARTDVLCRRGEGGACDANQTYSSYCKPNTSRRSAESMDDAIKHSIFNIHLTT